MHDRAAKPAGAIKSAAAIAIEIMILLSIDLRIAQVRPRVEKSVQRLPAPTHDLQNGAATGIRVRVRVRTESVLSVSAAEAVTDGKPSLLATVRFRLHFSEHLQSKQIIIPSRTRRRAL